MELAPYSAMATVRMTGDASSHWLVQARNFLNSLGSRDATILDQRTLRIGAHGPTLQELGERFGLSRERVRQIEVKAREMATSLVITAPNTALAAVVEQVHSIGPSFSVRELEDALGFPTGWPEIQPEVRLVLFLAGPFKCDADQFYREGFARHIRQVLQNLNQTATLTEVHEELLVLGITPDQADLILSSSPGIRIVGDHVIRWEGTLADKAAAVLSARQRVMTVAELHEDIGEGHINTLKNYVGSDFRFQRRGPRAWGLSEWGGETYQGIAIEMADELAGISAGMTVMRLQRILADKFGINPSSVEIMSATHPRFVREGSWVRLRREGEPYIPDSSLEETADCVFVDEGWAWRHVVCHDTVRGSGLIIPESFSTDLGVFPGSRREFQWDRGAIPVSWPGQSPAVGSLRAVIESLDATLNDLLFVCHVGSRFSFTLVRANELRSVDPMKKLLLRMGQREAGPDWVGICARAIGLPDHGLVDEIEALLIARGDQTVLRLFQASLRRTGDPR